jgi:hypothetical protein
MGLADEVQVTDADAHVTEGAVLGENAAAPYRV